MDKNKNKNVSMQYIFSKLSENNKDILILMAKSMKVAQEAGKQECKSFK